MRYTKIHKLLRRYVHISIFLIMLLTFFPIPCLSQDILPPLSKDQMTYSPNMALAINTIETNHFMDQFAKVIQKAKECALSNHSKNAAIVLDIDETLLSNLPFFKGNENYQNLEDFYVWINKGELEVIKPTQEFIEWAFSQGFKVILITGRYEILRTATEKNLERYSIKYHHLFLKPKNYNLKSSQPFKAAVRKMLTNEYGYEIVVNIGDQNSDLEGGYGTPFKVPNLMYNVP